MAGAWLNELQSRLEQFYGVQTLHRVADFLITDPALARELDSDPKARSVEEKLLIQQSEDGLDLALYLDPALLARLADPDTADLADFCTALEGVSHFLYLTWNAEQARSVTCLEMEMQAEVDKYITVADLLNRRHGRIPARLHDWLFEQVSFDAALTATERERYQDANRYAGKYCFQLERRYLRRRRGGMVADLRRFYRLGLRDKIRRIDFNPL